MAIVRPRESLDLVGELAVVQGGTYTYLEWVIPGDKTAWEPRGQIRTGLVGDGGELLTEFEFAASTYDEFADETTIRPRLTPDQTSALPPTRYQGKGTPNARSAYLYDLEIESDDGEVVKTRPGFIQVIGEVTD